MNKIVKLTAVLYISAVLLHFASTEIPLSIGVINLNGTSVWFEEQNPLYYQWGALIFWTVFFTLNGSAVALLIYVERTFSKPGRVRMVMLAVSCIIIWLLIAYHYYLSARNFGQLIV